MNNVLEGRNEIDSKGQFKKGMTPWNYEGKGKLKRKYKRFKGELILKSHFVYLNYSGLDKIPRGYIIHHVDGNSLNDKIENLILMRRKDHILLHHDKFKKSISGGL